MKNKIYLVGITAFLLVWFGLTGAAWFGKAEAYSGTERRPLNQAPKLSMETILAKDVLNDDGSVKEAKSYKTLFEKYSLDQFPLRDQFRKAKAIYSNYVMQQMDDNGYYIKEGYAAEVLYPLSERDLNRNVTTVKRIQDKYLKRCKNVYTAIVPDKGYFLAEKHGYLSLDYNKMYQTVTDSLPNTTMIDLREVLTLEDYYRTDTHWRQEALVPVAQYIGQATGVTMDGPEAYTQEKVDVPFHGFYYGAAAMPMDPDIMYLMHSQVLDGCTVRLLDQVGATPMQHQWTEHQFYDMSKTELSDKNNDLYNIFLSTNQTMVEITNPKAPRNRELVIFGDSYSRSLLPLLVSGYYKVTLIDLRNIKGMTEFLDQYMMFTPKQDVLFIYGAISWNSAIAS